MLTEQVIDCFVEELSDHVGWEVSDKVTSKYKRQKSTRAAEGTVPGEVVQFPITDSGSGNTKGDFGSVYYRSVKSWLLKLGNDPAVRDRWRDDAKRLEDKYMWGSVKSEQVFSHPMRGQRAQRMLQEANGPTIMLELYTDGVTHGKGIIGTRKKSKLVHVYVAVR